MFVIADQGSFNVLVYRSRMVLCFLSAEFTWTAVEFEIIFSILFQDALAELLNYIYLLISFQVLALNHGSGFLDRVGGSLENCGGTAMIRKHRLVISTVRNRLKITLALTKQKIKLKSRTFCENEFSTHKLKSEQQENFLIIV